MYRFSACDPAFSPPRSATGDVLANNVTHVSGVTTNPEITNLGHMDTSASPADPAEQASRIVILGTGGTISCTTAADGSLRPTLSIAEIFAKAQVELPGNVEVTCQDVMTLDSSAIRLEDIDELIAHAHRSIRTAEAGSVRLAGIVVVHGTDSMEETAMAFDQSLLGPTPIVFTGAQRPADDQHPDGPGNLRRAIEFLLSAPAASRPHVVFGGQTLPAFGATKIHTTADAGFASTVEDAAQTESELRFLLPASERGETRDTSPLAGLFVPIFDAHIAANPVLIEMLLDPHSAAPTPDGLVIAAMGSGNVPPPMVDAMREATNPIVICSRVPFGGVHFVYGGSGGGASLAQLGMLSGGALRPAQARMALLAHLARGRQDN